MIKQSIYPKTKRISCAGINVYLTEKIDGSNLVFFKFENELYIAQRKNIFTLAEIEEVKDIMYKGMYMFLKENGENLKAHLIEGSAICVEWMGMGKLKYPSFDKKFYMFAKAKIDKDEFGHFELRKMIYTHDLFIYPFDNQIIPDYVGIVPEVVTLDYYPKKEDLDKLYTEYTEKVGRNVEGFVVNYKNTVEKYVRMKNGKLSEHFDRE